MTGNFVLLNSLLRVHRSYYSTQYSLLIYGTIANESVGKLFIGGVIPGILMGIALMVLCYFIGQRRHYIGRKQSPP